MSNVSWLKIVDRRIVSLNLYYPESTELVRMKEVVRPDIFSRLTDDELLEYTTGNVITPEEKERIRLEELAAMEQNRDSQSI